MGNQLWQAQAAAAAAAPDPVPATVTAHVHHAQPTHTAHVHHVQPTHTAVFTPRWTGPVAATIPAGVPGSVSQVPDTPEVAAARSAFLATYNAAFGAVRPTITTHFTPSVVSAPQAVSITRWNGPFAATAAFQQAYRNQVIATTGQLI